MAPISSHLLPSIPIAPIHLQKFVALNCFQISIFVWPQTPVSDIVPAYHLLWIAFKLVSLCDHKHLDWDLWHIWELKDQLDLIKRCRDKEDFKNWNAAKKHLRDILGSKPEAVEDPRRMEKNVFYIQVNNGTNQQLNIPLDTIRSLSADDRRIILENMSEPLDEADADQIFDSWLQNEVGK